MQTLGNSQTPRVRTSKLDQNRNVSTEVKKLPIIASEGCPAAINMFIMIPSQTLLAT